MLENGVRLGRTAGPAALLLTQPDSEGKGRFLVRKGAKVLDHVEESPTRSR